MFDVKQEPVSLQDSNLARSLMNLVEIQMKDIHEEETKYIKSWLIVSGIFGYLVAFLIVGILLFTGFN